MLGGIVSGAGFILVVLLSLTPVVREIIDNSDNCVLKPQADVGRDCMDLSTGRIVACTRADPAGPMIRGTLVHGAFQPSHEVLFSEKAKAAVSSDWVPGWIELRSGAIHSDVEAVAPQQPYLRGMIDSWREFHVNPEALNRWATAVR